MRGRQQVAKDDGRIKTEYLTYPSSQGSGTMRAISRSANPAATARHPGHTREPRLNPYTEDVARRLAVANSWLSRRMRSRPSAVTRRRRQGERAVCQLDAAKRTEDLVAAAGYLKSRPECTGKIGAVGFCFGGGIVTCWRAVAGSRGRVPFYGSQPALRMSPKSKRRCRFTTRKPTSASTPAGPLMKPRSRQTASGTRCICTRILITPFITTRHPATTKPQPNWRGKGRSISSTRTCVDRLREQPRKPGSLHAACVRRSMINILRKDISR